MAPPAWLEGALRRSPSAARSSLTWNSRAAARTQLRAVRVRGVFPVATPLLPPPPAQALYPRAFRCTCYPRACHPLACRCPCALSLRAHAWAQQHWSGPALWTLRTGSLLAGSCVASSSLGKCAAAWGRLGCAPLGECLGASDWPRSEFALGRRTRKPLGIPPATCLTAQVAWYPTHTTAHARVRVAQHCVSCSSSASANSTW